MQPKLNQHLPFRPRCLTEIKGQNYLLKRGSIDTSTVKAVFTLLAVLYGGTITI